MTRGERFDERRLARVRATEAKRERKQAKREARRRRRAERGPLEHRSTGILPKDEREKLGRAREPHRPKFGCPVCGKRTIDVVGEEWRCVAGPTDARSGIKRLECGARGIVDRKLEGRNRYVVTRRLESEETRDKRLRRRRLSRAA